ncbi:polysaccharide biosynthesis tyrosine autokinase [Stieleria sp. ICT_E10.1]|uniref:polysaccharide biosynthesis tyrosine autokinase n=1 Tax=Stieleria sedimenti TaxID=2976331 RepID=UPI0021802DC0|nr:polysaccharide biosynthesis tyrosine autokinase [Stieleria sedimenti]MCS7470879.1 polysaccharide biosynthesis tyrosine autokinase [Stieleria sedimenti]
MLEPSSPNVHSDSGHAMERDGGRMDGEPIGTVLWRYKWLIGILLPIGTLLGYWVNRHKPMTYRATTRLMFRTDTPLTLDTSTGLIRGGIPSGNLMQSLISSDAIAGRVHLDEQLRSIPALRELTDDQFIALVRGGIQFQTITDLKDSRDRLIAAVHFDGHDPEVCVAAVNSVSDAIQSHFQEERELRVNEFEQLVSQAQEKLLPQQAELEEAYKTFREAAPLEWDPNGQVVNPHRQRQFQLQSFRDQLERKHRQLDGELRFAESMRSRHKNPLMVAMIIGQLSDVFEDSRLMLNGGATKSLATDDLEMQKIEVEKKLVPLVIRREQLEMAYGRSHPEVKSIVMQIESSQSKLNELIAQVDRRRKELSEQSQQIAEADGSSKAQVVRAGEAVDAYIRGLSERLRVANEDLNDVDRKIEAEKLAADELKKFEDTDASFRRRIASLQGMLIQLEQQLAALELIDINGGILVEPLLATGKAHRTGPELKKDLAVFTMLGLGLSGLLALLFEAGAKTFRSAEAIQLELQAPVLTHIPFDGGRGQNQKPMPANSIARLDPKLAVIHRPHSPAAESVRAVRTAMLLDRQKMDSKVFQITSPLPGDGKSTLAANVGCSIAQSGKRTLLIDLDLRSPRLSLRFNLDTKIGLANVLNGELSAAQAVHQSPIENLDILPCGPLPANPAEALTLTELADVFQWARANYDFIIVDTPPLLMVSDPTIVTTYVDAAILVMRIRRRCKPNAKEAVAMLRWTGSRVMGVVINKFTSPHSTASYQSSASGSYQSIGYGYGDRYRRRYQREVNAQDTYVVTGTKNLERVDRVVPSEANRTGRPHLHQVAPQDSSPRPRPL